MDIPFLNILPVVALFMFALHVVDKKTDKFDEKIIGLIVITLVLCCALLAFMWKNVGIDFLEKILLTVLGFCGGLFAAQRGQAQSDVSNPSDKK